MRNLKTTKQVVEKYYKVLDKRGKQMSALYPTPSISINPNAYRQRLVVVGDTKKTQTAYDRYDQIRFARSLFASMPDLGGALLSKAQWCVSSGFNPVFTGKDKEWGDKVEEWLVQSWYPTCNVLGSNFDFKTTLYLSSLSIDVDGDSGILLTTTRSGYPQIQLISSHRIGQRISTNNDVVVGGKYDGYTINDGCIFNASGRCIAYRILGDTPSDDVDISASALQLLYEPEWCDQSGRGISRIARSTLDWCDTQDINEFTKRSIKIASTIGLIHTTESGTPDTGANLVGAVEDEGLPTQTNPVIEIVKGGEIYYMKAGVGEDIKAMKDDRPDPNTQQFLDRIQRRALYSAGWPVELLDPSKLNGGAVRLIQDLARKSISSRQITLERRAKLMVNYAVAKAMNAGLIPQTNGDWYSWNFTKAGVIQVDLGNEENAAREAYKLGTITLSDIASKAGKDWFELREQQQIETSDLLDRANKLSTQYNITLDSALSLLSQRAPNQVPVTGTGGGESMPINKDNVQTT